MVLRADERSMMKLFNEVLGVRDDVLGEKAKKKSPLEKFKEKHGIVGEKSQSYHDVHSIGYSDKEKKWYGWSHRAIFGFGVGHTVKDNGNDMPMKYKGKTAKNLADARKFAVAFAGEVS
jgi:hypothetical protein